jgi:hypothetical protein
MEMGIFLICLLPRSPSCKSNRMLKKSASGVLTSLRGSTYRSVCLASSLVAALLDDLFKHPDVIEALAQSEIVQRHFMYKPRFSAACQGGIVHGGSRRRGLVIFSLTP